MKEILRTDMGILWVNEDKQGRMLVFMADTDTDTEDVFQIGLSWTSLEKLKARSSRKVFEWEIKDKSLKVGGVNGKWKLTLRSLNIPLTVDILLSEEETRQLQVALWSPLGKSTETH
jgi:hypothetical protein